MSELKTRLMATSPFYNGDTSPEVFRVTVTNKELDCHLNWPDLRDLLMAKGIPLYKLVDGANYRMTQIKGGVVLEFD